MLYKHNYKIFEDSFTVSKGTLFTRTGFPGTLLSGSGNHFFDTFSLETRFLEDFSFS